MEKLHKDEKRVFESAFGGVSVYRRSIQSLFFKQSQNDFGPEAISTILKYMEDKEMT
ncbi:MAG: hypothetical protein CM15mP40_13970 [Alphaproteobacteria bacterium]|nr:MAG: hypothetical protein CM15mP40_13970 [Alphaproteobacteria bacterium]